MSFQDYRHGSTNSSTAGGARGAYNSNKPASSRGGLGGGDWGDAAGRQRPSSGGFGSAGPLRTGGVGVGVGSRPISGGGALHHGGVGAGGVGVGSGGASGGGKVGDYLMGYSVSCGKGAMRVRKGMGGRERDKETKKRNMRRKRGEVD